MEMKNSNSTTPMLTAQVNTAMAWPLRIALYLFTQVIELVINIPIMNTVWRERREMELLTIEHIKDMGLTPDAVRMEVKRSFFDIPIERKRFFIPRKAFVASKAF